MYETLTFIGHLFGGLVVALAAMSGLRWHEAAVLPLPNVPADLLSPTVSPTGERLSLNMAQEGDRRQAFAVAMDEALRSLQRSGQINRSAAWWAVGSAFSAAVAFAVPIARDFAVWMSWIALPLT